MSKKVEDSELQTLTLSPTNTNEDESALFVNPASDETTFPPPAFPPAPPPAPPAGEKKKIERMSSVPLSNVKTVPTLRVSTPPGSARISYTNEKGSGKVDFGKISRDRPTPGSTMGQKKDGLRHSEKSRPSGLVLNIGGKGIPSTKSSLKKADSGGHSKHSPGSQGTKASTKRSEIDPSMHPLAKGAGFHPLGKGGFFFGQGSATPLNSRVGVGPKGWPGRVGVPRSGPRIRDGIDCRQMDRPTQHHTFLTDVADVRQIEQGLLQLMEDFQAGNLRAFGKDSRLRQMEAIREQQERLARLHFDVGAEQDLHPPLSEEGLKASHENMRTLMEKLAQLSESIENLHTNTSNDRKTSGHQTSSTQPPSQRLSDHFNHSNLNILMANDGHSSRPGDSANTSAPIATSSPQNANANSNLSGNFSNANHSSSPSNSNLSHGQHGTHVSNRSRNAKNGKNSDS